MGGGLRVKGKTHTQSITEDAECPQKTQSHSSKSEVEKKKHKGKGWKRETEGGERNYVSQDLIRSEAK